MIIDPISTMRLPMNGNEVLDQHLQDLGLGRFCSRFRNKHLAGIQQLQSRLFRKIIIEVFIHIDPVLQIERFKADLEQGMGAIKGSMLHGVAETRL